MIQKLEFHENNKPNNVMVVETNQETDNKNKKHFKNELTSCIMNKMTHELVAYIWFYLNFTEPQKIKQEHIDLIRTRS